MHPCVPADPALIILGLEPVSPVLDDLTSQRGEASASGHLAPQMFRMAMAAALALALVREVEQH